MFRAGAVTVTLCAALMCSGPARAQVPRMVGYHGVLKTKTGKPQTGPTTFMFSIYDKPTSGTRLWTGQYGATVNKDGLFDVAVGSGAYGLPSSLFSGSPRYLEVTVAGTTLSPRQQILSVPYALTAPSSGTAAGGGFTINGSVEIDAAFGESFSLILSKAAKSVSLFFRGAAFSAFHYTELPYHSHAISGSVKVPNPTCTSAGGHGHTLSGPI